MFNSFGTVMFCINLHLSGISFEIADDGHVRYGTELYGGCYPGWTTP